MSPIIYPFVRIQYHVIVSSDIGLTVFHEKQNGGTESRLCTYLSVSRRNTIGKNSNFSSQLRFQLQCVSPIIYPFVCIQYHVIVSSDIGLTVFHEKQNGGTESRLLKTRCYYICAHFSKVLFAHSFYLRAEMYIICAQFYCYICTHVFVPFPWPSAGINKISAPIHQPADGRVRTSLHCHLKVNF